MSKSVLSKISAQAISAAKKKATRARGVSFLRRFNPFRPKIKGHQYEHFLQNLSPESRDIWIRHHNAGIDKRSQAKQEKVRRDEHKPAHIQRSPYAIRHH